VQEIRAHSALSLCGLGSYAEAPIEMIWAIWRPLCSNRAAGAGGVTTRDLDLPDCGVRVSIAKRRIGGSGGERQQNCQRRRQQDCAFCDFEHFFPPFEPGIPKSSCISRAGQIQTACRHRRLLWKSESAVGAG
jgi:hypothetical protein